MNTKFVGRTIIFAMLLGIIFWPKTPQIGDVNKDGEINLLDLLTLVKYLNHETEIATSDLYLLDFNGDGVVDEKDLVALQSFLLGIK